MQLLRKLLFPFSLVYGLIVYVRNFFYDKGIFNSKKFDVPLVCVGNLSVGGTGKTPMTEFLIKLLKPHYKVAVLSRGYKRKSTGFIMADEHSTVEQLGDEPYQIHQKFKDVAVAVEANRREGISRLNKEVNPDIILLDDAYQHRKVAPGFSILLTSYGNLYVDDWYLPTGNLRDGKIAAKRANLIVVTKCPPNMKREEQIRITGKLKPLAHQKILFSFLDYDQEVHNDSHAILLDTLKQRDITLVTGIANPSPLVQYLKSQGFSFEHSAFNDHHFFSEKEIESLRKKELILTTEKDYGRLRNQLSNMYYLPVRHKFFQEGEKEIYDDLQKFMKERI